MALGEFFYGFVVLMGLVLPPLHAEGVARTIEGVAFAAQHDLDGKALPLHGVGLRVKRKFGMNFKVYVAGLYTTVAGPNRDELLNGESVLRLVFLRSLSASTLREAWTESYDKSCKAECAALKSHLQTFNSLMVDVKDKSEITLMFAGDTVNVDIQGKSSKHEKIVSGAFRKLLLSLFIGDNPPTEELREGLLGKI